MENDDIEFKELSPGEIKEMLLGIRYIFINYPPEKLKEIIWQLYRGWVYNSAEWVQQDDIKDMLLFYDFITHLIDDLFEYSQYLNR
ncbi:hypothetical protein DIU31_019255 [Mucilaginibacter rubeus]|uniref:Uncharacterized protein n=1 Tax=Mucilaginibacter rubeus TaxID=2027860 RepID=A0AAE6JHI2_9SPHI|nr:MULTISPECIES: hypothetical protein [Mucilaginibacter]QEM05551.1 hypothetical protein DIU31_019255 [Mucilaginibacter rubeus]QEM18138.1 hypothetical protein DIU38_019450 [Mucilaginibacter gossypii]QTE45329.1 hypothetical protein J3L19_08250 [Mucilaginibacter rubeus]QTE51925.1 hypothetical protein J3L21_08230 [Mucilaginibacter rubeus]QTE57013.1 hypothetical protein J3L23_33460 [Mucilaginibacter rubeus]